MDKDHLRGACPAGSGLFEYLKQVPSLRKIMALREREFRADPVARLLFDDQRLFLASVPRDFPKVPFSQNCFLADKIGRTEKVRDKRAAL